MHAAIPRETIFSAREFNQDTARAKRAANDGPVIITDRGRPAYVLLKHADYERLAPKPQSIVEALAMRGEGAELDFDFDPPRMGDFARAAEFD